MANRLTQLVLALLAIPAVLIPLACLGYLCYRGLPAIQTLLLDVSDPVTSFTNNNDVLPAIAGSLSLGLLACLIALPLAIALAIRDRLSKSVIGASLMRHLLTMFQSVPPLVYGLCGLAVLVHFLGLGISLAAGTLILALIILPVLTLNTIDALERVPVEYTDAARALGMSAGQIVWHVWRPHAWRSLLTGMFLAMARTLSETAPILFTATVFSGAGWPDSLLAPVSSLQTHIFYLAQEAVDEKTVAIAWSSALILVTLVALFSLIAQTLGRLGARHDQRNTRH